MHDPMNLLLFACAFGFALLWWRASVEARDRANAAAHRACEDAGVQLLDGTVSFQRMRPTRDAAGRLAFRRTYVFDYTDDGHTRRQGFVAMHGHEIEVVGLGPTLVTSNVPDTRQ
jgi:hypothetical protein